MQKKDRNNRSFGLSGVAQIVAQQEPNEMQYIALRGRTYWFRRRAPQPILPEMPLRLGEVQTRVGKNGYVTFSLNTTDQREARKAARKYAHLLDQVVDSFGATETPPLVVESASGIVIGEHTPEEISRAADAMYAALMADDESKDHAAVVAEFNGREWKGTSISGVAFLPEVPTPQRYALNQNDLPEALPPGNAELIREIWGLACLYLLKTTNRFPSRPDARLLPFAHAYRRFAAAMEKRKGGEIIPTPAPPPAPTAPWGWNDAFDYYFQRKNKLPKETRDNYRLAWASLEANSKCLPAELTIDHIIRWIETGLAHLHDTTKGTRFTWAKVIWEYSRKHNKIPRATFCPFEGLQASEGRTKSSRREFSLDELKTIFAAPPLSTDRAVSVHAGYWIPLLALYLGARLEELTGLEVSDIEDSSAATLTIRIRENVTRPKLKNEWSRRFIPVHPKLLELGFKEYVLAARQAGVKQLFPSLASGASFGEEYVEYVKELIPLDPLEPKRLVGMHCFRHNWETAKRNSLDAVDITATNYLLGRKYEKGSSVDYGSQAAIPKLLRELQKISYELTFQLPPAVTAADLKGQEAQLLRSKDAGQRRAKARALKKLAA